jgi:hypothetical protein
MLNSSLSLLDPGRNPLRRLPPAQRFQIMTVLALMWSVVFSAGAGNWLWFGELVGFHLLVLLAIATTASTFRISRAAMPRDRYRRADGTASNDDIWGG